MYTKIQSIELVSYNIPRAIMPTFVEAAIDPSGNAIVGNNKLDIRLADVPETQSLEFTVTFPPGRYESIEDFTDTIPALFGDAMDAEGDAFFNTGAGVAFVVISSTIDSVANIFSVISEIGGNNELISMEYLFESGVNTNNSAWNVFGFVQGEDSGGLQTVNVGNGLLAPTIIYDPVPTSAATVRPYRYIDVFIDEAPELSPVARIFLTDETTQESVYTTNKRIQNRVRLLKDLPIRKMSTMTVKIQFENNIVPTEEFECGYDFIFDLMVLSPEQSIPCWTEQQLTY
jgi:hypothetical protein